MIRNIVFQIHRYLGLSLGLVLIVSGLCGATMAFQEPIMAVLSHGIVDVPVRAAPVLTPDQLIAAFKKQMPDTVVRAVQLSRRAGDSPIISYLPLAKARDPNNGDESDALYQDPYTGHILGKARGQHFFETILLAHRYLLIPGGTNSFGRQITGAAVAALAFFSLTGLYLRWPRRVGDWRVWLKPDLKRRGRALYWSLHRVMGTWFLLVYLVIASAGLSWAYDWYRNGMTDLLAGPNFSAKGTGIAAIAKAPQHKKAKPAAVSLDRAWATFNRAVPGGSPSILFTVPAKATTAIGIHYLDWDAPHDRALNEMIVDSQSGVVLSQYRYRDLPLGKKLVIARLAVHRGIIFGLPGRILFMLAALCLPLFPLTGWYLYWGRPRKRRIATA